MDRCSSSYMKVSTEPDQNVCAQKSVGEWGDLSGWRGLMSASCCLPIEGSKPVGCWLDIGPGSGTLWWKHTEFVLGSQLKAAFWKAQARLVELTHLVYSNASIPLGQGQSVLPIRIVQWLRTVLFLHVGVSWLSLPCQHFACSPVPLHLCSFLPSLLFVSLQGIEMEIVDSCQKDNGGCSHGCEHTATGPRCSCHDGYVLSSDGKACTGNPGYNSCCQDHVCMQPN